MSLRRDAFHSAKRIYKFLTTARIFVTDKNRAPLGAGASQTESGARLHVKLSVLFRTPLLSAVWLPTFRRRGRTAHGARFQNSF